MKLPTLRKITILLVFVIVVAGLIFNTGIGTISSFGWREIAAVCPLGILEVFLAEKTLIPRALIVLLLVVAASVLLGKVFCSWICPVPPLRRFFGFKDKKRIAAKKESVANTLAGSSPEEGLDGTAELQESATPALTAPLSEEERAALSATGATVCASTSGCSSCAEKRAKLDSRHVVLGGALLSTAIFGFPVFCIICPVGLTFATIIAFWHWVGFNDLTLSLIVFPAILLVEILFLRKWCLKFCPMGALFSLMSLPNRFFKPKVDESACLRIKGIDCSICVEVCEEKLDPHFKEGMHECSKCGECAARCPAHAIVIPFSKPKGERADPPVTVDSSS